MHWLHWWRIWLALLDQCGGRGFAVFSFGIGLLYRRQSDIAGRAATTVAAPSAALARMLRCFSLTRPCTAAAAAWARASGGTGAFAAIIVVTRRSFTPFFALGVCPLSLCLGGSSCPTRPFHMLPPMKTGRAFPIAPFILLLPFLPCLCGLIRWSPAIWRPGPVACSACGGSLRGRSGGSPPSPAFPRPLLLRLLRLPPLIRPLSLILAVPFPLCLSPISSAPIILTPIILAAPPLLLLFPSVSTPIWICSIPLPPLLLFPSVSAPICTICSIPAAFCICTPVSPGILRRPGRGMPRSHGQCDPTEL